MKIKLNGLETRNYLARFYEALKQLNGTAIGNNGAILVVDNDITSPYLTNTGDDNNLPIFIAPAWSAYVDSQAEIECDLLGATGVTDILVQYGYLNEMLVKTPFFMTFDIQQDVAYFLECVQRIDSIEYEAPVDAVMRVLVGNITYTNAGCVSK